MELLSIFVIVAGLLIYNNPPIEERVILIPDADGKVGEIFVTNPSSSQTVNQAYMSIDVENKSTLSAPKQLDKEAVLDNFSTALAAVPQPPSRYILYFNSGSTELTEESIQLIDKIVTDVNSREVYNVFIDGHTDTQGSQEINASLALERAHIVNKLFGDKLPKPEKVKVSSHGEGNLLIKTEDNVSEPRNRRVEVVIQ